ncbi:MAG TPA: glutathione S-transferase N-terminal domain-containing protein [Roseiarcus sp.]|nr:glutathione S-transferase N-terminal domain-containing protein [Roseiarcus sp.]
MQLIGMLDSPYVRRVAIALLRLGLPFEHRPLSIFRHIDEFRAINPLLKAPTFVADDGTVLVESTLIIDYAESLAPRAPRLTPGAPATKLKSYRLNGLALTVNEKAVQAHYERQLRPPEKQHEPWLGRVRGQLEAGLEMLDRETAKTQNWLVGENLMLADITVATAFAFVQLNLADLAPAARYPALAAFCRRAEALSEFRAAPCEDGVKIAAPVMTA